MTKRTLGKPTLGINQLNDETALEAEEIREGVNIDIDAEGNVSRRKGARLAIAGSGFHSLYAPKQGGLALCNSEQFGFFNLATEQFQPLYTMDDNVRVSYAELNGNLYCVNIYEAFYVPYDTTLVKPVGVALPDVQAVFSANSDGGLDEGTYACAYTILDSDGEESPLSPVTTVTLESTGGITISALTLAAGYSYRVYMTATNGEQLRQAAEFPADTVTFFIGEYEEGRVPATEDLSLLPGGYELISYNSRLFVGQKDQVVYSHTFRPHLHNPAHDFIPITGLPSLLLDVDGGIYIGDDRGVRFYRGGDPKEFVVIESSDELPVFGSGKSVPGEWMGEPFNQFDRVGVWLTRSGYQVGTPDGEVVRIHANRVSLPKYAKASSELVFNDGRKQLLTVVNSNAQTGFGVAQDSVIED